MIVVILRIHPGLLILILLKHQQKEGIVIYAYRYEDYTLKKAQQTDCTSSLDFTPLISPDISIDSTIIKVDNTSQPRVFLLLKGHNGEREREKTTFVLQTTISQRIK